MRKITNELILNFKNYLIEEEKSDNTIEKYVRDITFFAKWLCGTEVTKLLVLDYKKELCEKYSPASVNAAISSLNSFFGFMEWSDLSIKALKIQRQIFSNKDKELSKTEYERLLMDAVTLEENLHFTDADEISEYAVPAMNWAAGTGLMNGKTTTTINPKDNATRAEIAAILQRFIENN